MPTYMHTCISSASYRRSRPDHKSLGRRPCQPTQWVLELPSFALSPNHGLGASIAAISATSALLGSPSLLLVVLLTLLRPDILTE